MLLTQDRAPRTESLCRCGRKTELQVGDRAFFIGTRKILIRNVPHFYCSYCDKATYDSEVNIDDALKFAYREGIDSLDWETFKKQ